LIRVRGRNGLDSVARTKKFSHSQATKKIYSLVAGTRASIAVILKFGELS
jgi:hypothetical protein